LRYKFVPHFDKGTDEVQENDKKTTNTYKKPSKEGSILSQYIKGVWAV